ncbi:hypothetical protein J2X31_002517 [Flavobacterium arsenatis]|uniref:Uncharacterized protein n=1 Tax=Flavobacterium arsenatis TaxID=1484332 RepID=A0ABU1TRJ8_9FLAO|nr:hypothetical protein [Flavobacterium arsenatis]MDR6968494.1 hypothetical protein [Flavobacterium arsenatis]
MKAIDYGIQNFGNYSYKNTTSNIYIFNEGIVIEDESNDSSNPDSIDLIIYRQIEFVTEEKDVFKYLNDGDYFLSSTLLYIQESGIVPVEAFLVTTRNETTSDDEWNYSEKTIYTIEGKMYTTNDDVNFELDDVVVSPATHTKKNKPLFLLNDILHEKSISVVAFISDDGVKLERAYQSIECYANEVVLFLENDFGSNLFGSTLRIKLGKNITENSKFPASQTAKVIQAFKLGIDIDAKTLTQAIVAQVRSNVGLMHFMKNRLSAVDKIVSIPINIALDKVEIGLTAIANGIGSLKFDENRWRYYNPDGTKNKDENLLFFNPAVFEASDEKAQKKAHNMMFSHALKEVNSLEKSFYQHVNIARSTHADLKDFDSFLSTALSNLLRALYPVKEFLLNPEDLIISITKDALIALNAFVVGLINGIIDIFKGIFDILALLCKAFSGARNGFREVVSNLGSYVVMFLEALENMVDTVTNLFSKENLKAFVVFFMELQKILFVLPFVFALFVWNTGQSIHVDALGYYTGFIIGMLVDIIISIVFTGGAKTVADVMRLLQEQLKTVFKLIQKAVAKTGEAILRSIDEIIAIFAKIRNGAKNIKPFLDEILEWLRVFFGALPKQLYEFFTKFGISIKKVPQGVLYSGIPVKVGDDVYALIKDGKEIFRGTRKEIDDLAKKLDELSEEAGKKYLDDLLEQKKLDDFINSQNFKFRKLGYIYSHFIRKSKDGVLEINHYLKSNKGELYWQGMSTISKDGVLFNVFEVTLQQHDVSTAMYKLLDKYGFSKIEAHYGSGSLGTNYKEFMKIYSIEKDNRIEAALATPAGKALNKALNNKFTPTNIIIKENDKIELFWIKK